MPSIYEQIGGKPSVAAAVDDLYVRIFDDPEVADYFTGVDMTRQKTHLRANPPEPLHNDMRPATTVMRRRAYVGKTVFPDGPS